MMILGQNIQLWVGDKTIAFAKSASFNITAEEVDSSTKDSGGFTNIEIGLIEWEMQSSNVIGNPRSGLSYDELVELMLKREKVTVIYGLKDAISDRTEEYHVPETNGWPKPTTSSYYTGDAYITSISNTSNNGEVATFDVTLKGCSALRQVKSTGSGATAVTMSLPKSGNSSAKA